VDNKDVEENVVMVTKEGGEDVGWSSGLPWLLPPHLAVEKA